MAFSKSIQKGQMPINCQLCETDKVIKWKCIECNLLMCNNCRERIHPKFRNATDHKIVDIKDVGHYNEQLDFTNIKCNEHAGQFSCLFCKKCNSLVCPTCVSKVHKKHANDLIEICEAYKMKIDVLKEGQNQLENSEVSMITIKDQLGQLKATENSKHMKVRQDILSHQKTLKKQIDDDFQQLDRELDTTSKSVLKHIEHDLSVIVGSIQDVENNKGQIKQFLKITDASNFFKNIRKIEKSIAVPTVQITDPYESIPKFIPGEVMQSIVGVLKSDDKQSIELNVDMVINKTFKTDISAVTYVCSCMNDDKSIWIACGIDNVVKRVKRDGNQLKDISSLKTEVYGMTILSSNDVLLSTKRSILQKLHVSTGELTDTVYKVSPLLSTAVHITRDIKVVVGGASINKNKKLGRTAVYVMNEKGDHETVFEHDQHNRPIFTYPVTITSTRNGNIHVADCHPKSDKGTVVVLEQRGGIINSYTGHAEINKDTLFRPGGIVTTPRNNVIVADLSTSVLHILNHGGHLMTYLKTKSNGIYYPFSLAFAPTGNLYIGCGTIKDSTTKEAKLYEVTITGC